MKGTVTHKEVNLDYELFAMEGISRPGVSHLQGLEGVETNMNEIHQWGDG
jgi:hypothetical protein